MSPSNVHWLAEGSLQSRRYPSLNKHVNVDVVVIGAGLCGASTAWHSSQQGLQVALVEHETLHMAQQDEMLALSYKERQNGTTERLSKWDEKRHVWSTTCLSKIIV